MCAIVDRGRWGSEQSCSSPRTWRGKLRRLHCLQVGRLGATLPLGKMFTVALQKCSFASKRRNSTDSKGESVAKCGSCRPDAAVSGGSRDSESLQGLKSRH